MVIDAMSDGLSKFRGLRGRAGLPPTPMLNGSVGTLLMGTPSITYRGSLLARIELPPRIRTWDAAPGSPLFWVISTPAARPRTIWSTFVTTPTFAADPSTVETDPVIASRRCVPYPVTTTGSRIAAAGESVISAVTVPPEGMVTFWIDEPYPMRLARKRWVPAGTPVRVKPPSARGSSRCGGPAIATAPVASGWWGLAATD